MLVLLGWADENIALDFDLEDPGGNAITPATLPAGVAYRSADGLASASYVVATPQGGDWKIGNIRRADGGAIPETVKFVAVDPRVIGQFWIDRGPKSVGETFRLGARLLEENKAVEDAEITVEITAPRQGTGEVASSHAQAFPDVLAVMRKSKELVVQDFRTALLRDYLVRHELKTLPTIEDRIRLVRPRGADFLALMPPGTPHTARLGLEPPAGLYEAAFTPSVEGTHTFRFRARSRTASGAPIQRTYTISTYVHFKADPKLTEISTVPSGKWRKKYPRFRLSVTPRSLSADRMGPFRRDHVSFQIDNARFIGDVEEDGTGTYFRDFVLTSSQRPKNLRVRIGDVTINLRRVLLEKKRKS